MPTKKVITAADGLKSPLLSQAIKYGDTIYASGTVGMDFTTMKMVEGSVSDRTVCHSTPCEKRYTRHDSNFMIRGKPSRTLR